LNKNSDLIALKSMLIEVISMPGTKKTAINKKRIFYNL